MGARFKEALMDRLGYGSDVMRVPFSEDTRNNLKEFFSDAFMQTYTRCRSFEEFMFSSAVFVNWDAPLLVYSKTRFDTFVSETTSFTTWDEMLEKGGEIYQNVAGQGRS
ncbi:MAG: hypothetical protein LBT26_01760 [Clostridiales Family XIII bacterium]|jgi:hypothetical protein|nr:hypothetical protein [Clostridiales Family XIII bacterium]